MIIGKGCVYGKKGLSAIVVTLIIILLAIAAFAIFSNFFTNVIGDRTQELERESEDLRLDIQRADVEGNRSFVSLERSGSSDLNVVGANFVFSDGSSNAVVERNFDIGQRVVKTVDVVLCSEDFSQVDLGSEDLDLTVYPIVEFDGEEVMIESRASNLDYINVGDYSLENCSEESEGSDSSDGGSSDDSSDDGSTLPACTDSDGDGYVNESSGESCNISKVSASNYGDCNDDRADVNPGHQEVCGDQVDNDCDGQVDESCDEFICNDNDGDGYVEDKSYSICTNDQRGDCNDNNPNVHPGASEICGDNVDNDCDGEVDENCGQEAVPGDGSGEEGFEVEQEGLEAAFDTSSEPEQIIEELNIQNTGQTEIEVQVEVSDPIAPYTSMNSQVVLEPGSAEVVEVIFENPGEDQFRTRGPIEFVSGESSDSVDVVIGVR